MPVQLPCTAIRCRTCTAFTALLWSRFGGGLQVGDCNFQKSASSTHYVCIHRLHSLLVGILAFGWEGAAAQEVFIWRRKCLYIHTSSKTETKTEFVCSPRNISMNTCRKHVRVMLRIYFQCVQVQLFALLHLFDYL